jgi:hypothetical protein
MATTLLKTEREAEIARETARAHGRIIVDSWLADHKEDYQPSGENSKIIGDWLKANGDLELSYDNLEAAFHATKSQLAPVVPVDEFASVPLPASMPDIRTKADINQVPPEQFRAYMTTHRHKEPWKARVNFILQRPKEN